MERPQSVMELATGPETLTFPKIPSTADSMALAIKGNINTLFIIYLFFFQIFWMDALPMTPSECPMSI